MEGGPKNTLLISWFWANILWFKRSREILTGNWEPFLGEREAWNRKREHASRESSGWDWACFCYLNQAASSFLLSTKEMRGGRAWGLRPADQMGEGGAVRLNLATLCFLSQGTVFCHIFLSFRQRIFLPCLTWSCSPYKMQAFDLWKTLKHV